MSLLDVLENASCGDPFECPFDMYGKNGDGKYGCFARFPNGDPNEEDHGCIAHQAAQIIKEIKVSLELLKEQEAKTGHWIQSNPKFVSAKATGGSRMSTCSNCGKWGRKSFSFCPHCGAKMDS